MKKKWRGCIIIWRRREGEGREDRMEGRERRERRWVR